MTDCSIEQKNTAPLLLNLLLWNLYAFISKNSAKTSHELFIH